MKCLLALLSVLTVVNAGDLLSPGGTTFDFEQLSNERHGRQKEALENLLTPISETVLPRSTKNGNGVWASHYQGIWAPERIAPEFRKELLSLFQYKVEKLSDGRNALIASIPNEVELRAGATVAGGAGTGFINALELKERLSEETRFRFNFDYAHNGVNGHIIFYGFEDGFYKKKLFQKVFTFGGTGGDWKYFQGEIVFPSEVKYLMFFVRGNGVGTLKLASPELSRIENAKPVSIRAKTMANLDNSFALTQNDPGLLILESRLNIPSKSANLKALTLVVECPEEIEFLGHGNSSSIQLLENSVSDKIRKLEFSLNRQVFGTVMNYRNQSTIPLLLRSNVKPGTQLSAVKGVLFDDGKAVSERFSVPITMEESIVSPRKCNLYFPGMYENGSFINFSTPEAEQILADFYGRMGVRWIASGLPNEMQRERFRQSGVKIFTPELWQIANGYRVIAPGQIPEYARFVTAARDYDHEPPAVCPRIVYLRDPYYTEHVEPYLQQKLTGTDGLWSNWEPHMFFGRGCFCDDCITEFAEFLNEPREKVALLIPKQVVGGGEYSEKWRKFRSLQHGRLVQVLHESVMKATTGKIGFVPGPVLYYMTELKAYQGTELDVRDYLPSLKYIDPWGPYNCWPSSQPYPVKRAPSINSYLGAERVNEFRSRYFKQQNPGMLALPHGVQVNDWVTNPESIAMDLETFFLNGYQASTIYMFPHGYDNRYWRMFAETSDRIAGVEKFVVDGKRGSDPALQLLSPFPEKLLKLDPRWMEFVPEESREKAPYRTQRYEKNGETLLIVGNFWEKGDLFFKAMLPGFNEKTQYQVLELPNQRDWGVYTGEALATGIKLHTGALRWSYFKIVPADSNLQLTTGISDVEYERILSERLPQLKQAMVVEDKLDAAEAVNTQTVELTTVNSGKLRCVPEMDGQSFAFSSDEGKLSVASDGLALNQWIVDGTKLVDDAPPFGLGYLCFYKPSLQIAGEAFKITALKSVDGGIELTGELQVTDRLNLLLSGLSIQKKVFVSEDLRRVTIHIRLLNRSTPEEPKLFSLGARGHAMPTFWSTHTMKLGDRTISRRYQHEIFTFYPDNPEVKILEELYKPKETTTVLPANAEFSDGKSTLRETVTPANLRGGFIVWDSPRDKATWEGYFLPVELGVGQSVDYGFSYELLP